MYKLLDLIFQLDRFTKTTLQLFSDFILICLSFGLAMYLRLDSISFLYDRDFWLTLLIITPLTLIVFSKLEFYKTIIRYISYQVLYIIFFGVAFSSIIILFVSQTLNLFVPRSVPIIYFTLMIIFISGIRFALSIFYHKIKFDKRRNAAIYGAGESGRQLLNFLKNNNEFKPIFFFDDNNLIHNKNIMGLFVYSFKNASKLLKKHKVNIVLLAMPSISQSKKQKIINNLEKLNLEIKSIPNLKEILDEKNNLLDLKTVSIEELIGREPIKPIKKLLVPNIRNKTVLVSGAGGSIGTELCKQILAIQPEHLIMLDNSEFNLFQIERKLINLNKNIKLKITPILASIQDIDRIENIFKTFKIQTIYHSAAYKHVPLIEKNITEGIKSNIFGTQSLVKMSIKYKIEDFILISSDKAIRPTNFMGATKRISEIICLSNQTGKIKTKFCVVRFGNVIGSSGSVIPLFQEQISYGGPITVTHKKIKRFFMTISEAAELVIQSGALNNGGDIFILDMGKQINIFSIAKRMAILNGYQPYLSIKKSLKKQNKIQIKITGLRPGEKMYEELFKTKHSYKTIHPRIIRVHENNMDLTEVDKLIDLLYKSVKMNDIVLIKKILKKFDQEFNFQNEPCDFTLKN